MSMEYEAAIASARLASRDWLRFEDAIVAQVYERVKPWIDGGMQKPANLAFTAGLERTVATLCEEAVRQRTARYAVLAELTREAQVMGLYDSRPPSEPPADAVTPR
jgi:hypothetical protein